MLAILEQVAGAPEERIPPVLRTPVPPADSAAAAAAQASGLLLRPIAAGSNFLRASCAGAAERCGAEQLRALTPLAAQVAELDLSGATISDADLPTIAGLRHLTRLSLDRTAVTDAGLAHLGRLEHLEYLNLYGTAVTDAGMPALEPLGSLRSLYLWQTGVTAAGADPLAERLPRITINLGTSAAEIDSLSALP